MHATPHGWQVFDAERPILTYQYSFGPGIANALAVRGRRGLVVVSPPCRVEPGVLDDLVPYGKVDALVASNAFHHMGLGGWKERYPDAGLFAPAQSIARVEKQTKLSGIKPLSEAASITGPDRELVDMPHYKTGEVLVRLKTELGWLWYVTDVIMNMPKVPPNFPFNLVFKWTRSAPGLRMNGVAPLFMVKNKTKLRNWLGDEAASKPPSLVVACHGDVARMDPPGCDMRKALDLS